jgi:Big-like domain-containing protein/VCBS repeat protein/FG-GAP repeat protein
MQRLAQAGQLSALAFTFLFFRMPLESASTRPISLYTAASSAQVSGPVGVVTADFNGDGKVDLAVSTDGTLSACVAVMLGNGDGTFQSPVNYGNSNCGGSNVLAIVTGDFNRDGKPDLAVTSRQSVVSILLGNGDGTFQSPVNYSTGVLNNANFPTEITAVGDFNNDNNPDLIIVGVGGAAGVLLGNGDGTFHPAINFTVPTGGPFDNFSVAVSDFNRDGKLDAVVADGSVFSNSIYVLLGNGDGTFKTPVKYGADTSPNAVAVGDFNGDGFLDVATCNFGVNGPLNGDVSILLGNGDGTFRTAVNYPSGSPGNMLVAADLNGDGHLDLAVQSEGGYISVLAGNGNGTFQTPVNYGGGTNLGIAAGDFNGDHRLDLALVDSVTQSVDLLLNIGKGAFEASRFFTLTSDVSGEGITAADVNGDGKLDIASSNGSVLLGNGDGTFQPAVPFPTGGGSSIVAADFNGDGKKDLVTVGTLDNFLSISLGNGNGTFQSATRIAAICGPYVTTGDFNGDGKLDLAVVSNPSRCGGNAGLAVLLGNGDGTFQSPTIYPVGRQGNFSTIAVGDFNGDGKPDLAVCNGLDNTIDVLLNQGNGSFSVGSPIPVGSGPSAVTAGDFNHDGKLDLAVSNQSSNNVSVLLGTGDGTFMTPVTYAVGASPEFIVSTDLNHDGALDLAVANTNAGSISILSGNGDGTFTPAPNLPSVLVPLMMVAADFNRDGSADLAVATNTSSVSVMLDAEGNKVKLTSSANPSTSGQSVTFKATVTASLKRLGVAAASGSVTFKDGKTILGTVALSGGTATFTTSSLTAGNHSITANYSGDNNYNPNKSAALTQTVNP